MEGYDVNQALFYDDDTKDAMLNNFDRINRTNRIEFPKKNLGQQFLFLSILLILSDFFRRARCVVVVII